MNRDLRASCCMTCVQHGPAMLFSASTATLKVPAFWIPAYLIRLPMKRQRTWWMALLVDPSWDLSRNAIFTILTWNGISSILGAADCILMHPKVRERSGCLHDMNIWNRFFCFVWHFPPWGLPDPKLAVLNFTPLWFWNFMHPSSQLFSQLFLIVKEGGGSALRTNSCSIPDHMPIYESNDQHCYPTDPRVLRLLSSKTKKKKKTTETEKGKTSPTFLFVWLFVCLFLAVLTWGENYSQKNQRHKAVRNISQRKSELSVLEKSWTIAWFHHEARTLCFEEKAKCKLRERTCDDELCIFHDGKNKNICGEHSRTFEADCVSSGSPALRQIVQRSHLEKSLLFRYPRLFEHEYCSLMWENNGETKLQALVHKDRACLFGAWIVIKHTRDRNSAKSSILLCVSVKIWAKKLTRM